MNNHGQLNAGKAAPAPHVVHTTISLAPGIDETVTVVVDMQPGFAVANDPLTIWFVEREITRAIEEGRPIVILEFDSHEMGHTHERLLKLVEGYARARVMEKWEDDGGARVLAALDELGVASRKFRVCGVKADACVLETVKTLAALPSSSATVVQDACNSDNGRDSRVWHVDFPALANVTVEKHGSAVH